MTDAPALARLPSVSCEGGCDGESEASVCLLELIWVIDILMHLIFPRTMMKLYVYGENVFLNLSGAVHGNKESQVWLLIFNVVPAGVILLVLFAGIGVQSVISRVIKKARA